ncbi:hypothetical protein [Cytobacillus firmus]|uniref:Rubredoxin-like domain-containing protein n=1 Tax=Cytobacillus firmus DS1 TaxID=1307436 RepID=W7KY01_CYTFI|nr:hypothetical protein [Cytobacillus firmus]EWG11013.1 hypothetical protein PBF_10992 [Cytobacillus firmus DS1]
MIIIINRDNIHNRSTMKEGAKSIEQYICGWCGYLADMEADECNDDSCPCCGLDLIGAAEFDMWES